jgi:hypothetical protein
MRSDRHVGCFSLVTYHCFYEPLATSREALSGRLCLSVEILHSKVRELFTCCTFSSPLSHAGERGDEALLNFRNEEVRDLSSSTAARHVHIKAQSIHYIAVHPPSTRSV